MVFFGAVDWRLTLYKGDKVVRRLGAGHVDAPKPGSRALVRTPRRVTPGQFKLQLRVRQGTRETYDHVSFLIKP